MAGGDEQDEKIWYQLWNGEKAETVVWAVECPLNGIVVDLLTEILKVHTQILAGYEAPNLSIYPKGTTIDDYQQSEPLELDLELDDDQIQGTSKDEPLLVVRAHASNHPSSAANMQQQTTLERFRQYLRDANIRHINERVISILVSKFASSVQLADSPGRAKELYAQACLLPRSVTQVALQERHISVGEVFKSPDASTAVLLHAHENGTSKILKIGTKESLEQELQVWNAAEQIVEPGEVHYLVPLRFIEFLSADIEIGDYSDGSTRHPTVVRGGLLMKHYQGSLAQCKMSLSEEVLLRVGKCVEKAARTLHRAGFCHMDIKPSNILLFEGEFFLGDYGAAVRIGEGIREYTVQYFPRDGALEGSQETDFYLLVVTLLEMFGTISPPSKRNVGSSKSEIYDEVVKLKNGNVRQFLLSLLDER